MKPKTNNARRAAEFLATGGRRRIIIAVVSAAFVVTLLLILPVTHLGSLFNKVRIADFTVHEPAPRDLVSDRELVYIDEEATALKQDAVEQLVPAVLRVNEKITERSLAEFDRFTDVYLKFAGREHTAEKVYLEVQSAVPGAVPQDLVEDLVRHNHARRTLVQARALLATVMTEGLADVPDQVRRDVGADVYEVWRWRDGRQERAMVPASSMPTPEGLESYVEAAVADSDLEPREREAVFRLVRAFAEVNAFYDAQTTNENRRKAREAVEPVVRKLVAGEPIVNQGQIVTDEDMVKIRALGERSTTVNVLSLAGTVFFLVVLYGLGAWLLSRRIAGRRLEGGEVYLFLGLGLAYLVGAIVVSTLPGLPSWLPPSVLLPTALITMLVSILISERVAFIASLVFALALLPVAGMDIYTFLFAFFAGLAGTVSVVGASKRIDLIRASLLLSGGQALAFMFTGLFQSYELTWFLLGSAWAGLNGFLCGVLTLGFLPILEHVLNAPTRFRLMELSDLNAPILKRMLTLAPGTYGHSVSVANLAESACRELNANALLARVGAYYHDIGKIDQAEYFIENQTSSNKHDELKPSLSAAVIKSHVKIGVEKAKELGLPRQVVEIVAQHHGRSLISYFYQRALEENGNAAPEDFSYQGSPPASKEAAVVLIADSVEAASRVLKRPTLAKLEKFVWSIILEKFNAGQLSRSSLTFRDLEIVKRTFVQMLAGHFHTRIEYPKVKELQR
jgi:cyclic-di-AMP phosphodiesterase PgpH